MNYSGLYMGTSGILLPYKNQTQYPAEFEGRSRLQVYGHFFNSLEVNSIFYKLPRPATVAHWSESVPESFRFTFKLSKQITHNPGLSFERGDITAFVETVQVAGSKCGCILIQFPPSVKFNLFGRLADLLSAVKEETADRWPLAVEFRDRSWYRQESYDLLDELGATMVYHDKTGSQSPQPALDSDVIYLRFHGPDGNYRGSYDPGLLYEYAGYVSGWRQAGKTLYVYFNNTAGDALANLQTMQTYLADFS